MFKLFIKKTKRKMFFFITQKHKNRFVLIYANYNFYTPKKHTKKSKSKINFKKKQKQAEKASWKIEKHQRRMCSFSKFKQRSVLCMCFLFYFLDYKTIYFIFFYGTCYSLWCVFGLKWRFYGSRENIPRR